MPLRKRPRRLRSLDPLGDEPFLGLSPKMVTEIAQVIRAINQDGVTVLFNEQSVQHSLRLSDRGYILESGRVVLTGDSAELLADPRLNNIYMGLPAT